MDVSFAAGNSGQPSQVTGVGRVITELARQITHFSDLTVSSVGCFGGDWNPIFTDVQTGRWVEQVLGGSPPFRPCYKSRLGISGRFSSFYADWSLRGTVNRDHRRSSWCRTLNLLTRSLRRLLEADSRPGVGFEDVDVFISTFRPPPRWLPADLPRVVFIYDVYPLHFPQEAGLSVTGMLEQVLGSIVPSRDIIMVNSNFTRDDFCKLTGYPPDRVHVAYLAADERFKPVTDSISIERVRKKYQIGKQPYCLSVANPQPRKDLNTAIRAFAAAARAMPEWDGQMVLAGNPMAGWGYESVRATIAEFPELANRILSIGTVAEEDLPTIYSGALTLIFPSRFEGFGLPVLEAMSCGVPVISSNATSLPEVGGNAPIYCAPGDVDVFARAVVSLARDSARCKQMREAGLGQAARFSWNQAADRVRDAILHAVGEPLELQPSNVGDDGVFRGQRNALN